MEYFPANLTVNNTLSSSCPANGRGSTTQETSVDVATCLTLQVNASEGFSLYRFPNLFLNCKNMSKYTKYCKKPLITNVNGAYPKMLCLVWELRNFNFVADLFLSELSLLVLNLQTYFRLQIRDEIMESKQANGIWYKQLCTLGTNEYTLIKQSNFHIPYVFQFCNWDALAKMN